VRNYERECSKEKTAEGKKADANVENTSEKTKKLAAEKEKTGATKRKGKKEKEGAEDEVGIHSVD
jgi:hypothetical protein